MKKGFLIVIDGIDGSGKTTQIELLTKYLAEKNISFEVINFPRYEDNLYGKLIKRYLEGELGTIGEVNPYLVALAYAGDRILAKPEIENWLNEGKVVIVNRYVSASKAHLGANSEENNRKDFFKWLDRLEYEINGIPKEDITILLQVDPKIGQKNVIGKHRPDIHERSLNHLEQASKIYLQLASISSNWYVIDCMRNGGMKTAEEIHQEIIKILEKYYR